MNIIDTVKKLKEQSTLNPNRRHVLKAELMHQIRLSEQVVEVRTASVFTNIFSRPMPIIASLLIAVLLGGGSAAAAAEGAKPGDALYSIKVGVNEKVAAALALSDERRGEKEAELAARRLDEAAQLAAEGSLSAEVKADLETRFQEHADRVEDRIAKLEAKGNAVAAADVASKFEASLQAHQSILERLSLFTSSTVSSTAILRGNVGDKLKIVAGVRSKIDNDINIASSTPDVIVAAEGRITAAKNVIASSEKFIDSKEDSLGAEATAEANVKLAAAKNSLTEAEAKLALGASGEAFTLAGNALRTAQEARFAVRVRASVAATASSSNRGISASASSSAGVQATGSAPEDRGSDTGKENRDDHVPFQFDDDLETKLDSLLKFGL